MTYTYTIRRLYTMYINMYVLGRENLDQRNIDDGIYMYMHVVSLHLYMYMYM